jgi:stage II sporulation protein D
MRIFLFAVMFAGICYGQVTYKVQLSTTEGGGIIELPAEKYVAAVLAGESSTFRSEEALKAMAVAARTYAARLRGRHAAEGFDFCATTHCQRVDLHGGSRPDLMRAAEATAGELLWFEAKPAFAVYTRDCGGETENIQRVWPDVQSPYLMVHADPFCTRHSGATWSWAAQDQEIVAALQAAQLNVPNGLERIVIARRSDSQRATILELIGRDRQVAISASSFRFAIARQLGWNTLRSDRYEITSDAGQIYFHGTGEGHGVGLCQHGAEEMGLAGQTYREILAFYYPGTVLARNGEGLKWVRMAGEGVTVLSTHPDQDRAVLNVSEELIRELKIRFDETAPASTIRVYPNVETFRNATGEPGWVAARAAGSVIELQPTAVLQARGVLSSTLRHELLHIMIEQQAAPGLPVWFREGLVEYLDNSERRRTGDARTATDADLQQRQNLPQARAGYAEARARVNQLVLRYGDAAVLGWLRRGLPAEVKNSSTSNAATNSR